MVISSSTQSTEKINRRFASSFDDNVRQKQFHEYIHHYFSTLQYCFCTRVETMFHFHNGAREGHQADHCETIDLGDELFESFLRHERRLRQRRGKRSNFSATGTTLSVIHHIYSARTLTIFRVVNFVYIHVPSICLHILTVRWRTPERLSFIPPQADHLDVVGRLTPSMNGHQGLTAPRSLVSQAGPSYWDVCSC
jgi:hypothetical protein